MKTEYPLKTLFSQIGMVITSSIELPVILERIMHEIREYFHPQNWSLLRLDPNTNELFFMYAEGIDAKMIEQIRLHPGEGIAGTVARSGQALYVADVSRHPDFSNRVDLVSGFTTRSIIAVPLNFRNRVYGVIELINTDEGPHFTDDDYLVLQTIADFAAIAFANAQLYEEALEIANRDPLTGLNNRNRLEKMLADFDEHAGDSRRTTDREGQAIAILLDLDNFKDVNDIYGHQAGDRVLRTTAQALRGCIRSGDLLFRIGGDEFLAIIPLNDPAADVTAVIASFERKLQECRCQNGDDPFTVTLSYGIASGRLHDIRAVIDEADSRMYHQKSLHHKTDGSKARH